MKICFFNLNGYSLFNDKSSAPIGGTEIQLYQLAKQLSRYKNINVNYITGDWNQNKIEIYGKIHVYKSAIVNNSLFNILASPLIIWKTLNKTESDIYITSAAGVELGLLSIFCTLHHKKLVFRTASDKDFTPNVIQNPIFRVLYFYGLMSSNLIITQNITQQKTLLKKYNRSSTILNSAFTITNNNLKINKSDILWVGSCQQLKNPTMFIKIAKSFPHKKFVMICQKRLNQEKIYTEIVKLSSSLKNFKLIESVKYKHIQKYFNKAKILIGTSEYEGFPNTYLQACIGRTPIVSYKVNPNNFINKNQIGFVANGNYKMMKHQISKLLTDKKLWDQYSKNAYKYVSNNHNIKRVGEQWKDCLLKLINE